MTLYAVASVLQAYAARRASGPAVVKHPAYLAGLGCDGLAWGAQILAMTRLPMFTVEAILAASLAVTIFIRIVLQLAADQTWWTIPEVYLTVLAGGCGVLMYARTLEHGPVGPPTALLWVIMVVGPGAIGLIALGDTIVPGLELVGLAGVAAAIAGCIVLALSPTQAEASG